MLKLKLHWQVLIAMILGCFLGIFFKSFNLGPIYELITLLGTIFVRLLKMVMIP